MNGKILTAIGVAVCLALATGVVAFNPVSKVKEFDPKHALDFAKKVCNLGPRYGGNEAELKAANMMEAELRKYGLNVRKEKVDLGGGKYTYNVIGEIKGTDEPNKYMIVGSHIDSPGFCEGATDDAAAMGIQVEMARILAKNFRPKKTVLIIGFGGEELWFKGSEAFVKKHPEIVKNCEAVIDLNCVGAGQNVFLTRKSAKPEPVEGDPKLIKLLEECAKELGHPVKVGDTTYPSDTYPFYHNGTKRVPVCQVMSQPLEVPPWSESNTADKLDPKDMEKVGETVTLAVVKLTNAEPASKPLWEAKRAEESSGAGRLTPVWWVTTLLGVAAALLRPRGR